MDKSLCLLSKPFSKGSSAVELVEDLFDLVEFPFPFNELDLCIPDDEPVNVSVITLHGFLFPITIGLEDFK